VPEGKVVKNRVHLDLLPTADSRDEEVTRLLGIGARLVADHRKADGSGWVVLADPEGNEFCVEQGGRQRLGGAGRSGGQRVLRGAQHEGAKPGLTTEATVRSKELKIFL
jgi:Glyoxalase-like domain